MTSRDGLELEVQVDGHGDSGRSDGPYLGPDYVAGAVAVLEQVVDGAMPHIQDERAHRATFVAHLDRWLDRHG